MVSPTDEQLVAQVREGRISAFETLVKRYQDRLVSFTKRIVGDERLAEEVVQDSFVKVYTAIDRIDTSRKFSTFLFTVAQNTAVSELRKLKKELPLSENLPAREESHWEKAAREEEKGLAQGALELLEGKYRKIIRLYYFDDLSYEEISRKLRMPVNTVRTHLRRGKDILRKILKDKIKLGLYEQKN